MSAAIGSDGRPQARRSGTSGTDSVTKNENALEIRFQIHPKSNARQSGELVQQLTEVGRLPRIAQVLALAIHFEDMIRRGEARDYADIARLGGLCRERVSQIMRLTYLAPDIQVELLHIPPTQTGRFPISETGARNIANLLSWPRQREAWIRLKKHHHVS